MSSRPSTSFLSVTILCASALVACGDDTTGSGGAGGEGGGGGAGTTSSTTTSSSTSSAGGGGAGGAGGSGGSAACEITPPSAYDGASFATNAADELDLRARLGALNAAMLAAEQDLSVTPTEAELDALFDAGTPSLRTSTSDYYAGIVDGIFTRFAAAAGNTWTPAVTPVAPGGKFGSYIFDERGLDLRQLVEKGMFEATFYRRFAELAEGELDAATLDRLLALYGAHPDFPGVSEAAPVVTNPDRLAAQYLERRSPKDPSDPSLPLDPANPGPYFRVKADFLFAQAALAEGSPDCVAAAEEAVERIRSEWERGIAATSIYYFNAAGVTLGTDGATEAQLASGLHGYNEGIAFLWGFRQLPQEHRTITDAQIDALLSLVKTPVDAPSTAFEYLTDSSNVSKLTDAIDDLQDVYGFTDAEVLNFKTNY